MRGIEVCPSTKLFSTLWKQRSTTLLLTIYSQIYPLFMLIGKLIANPLVMKMEMTTIGTGMLLIILINVIWIL